MRGVSASATTRGTSAEVSHYLTGDGSHAVGPVVVDGAAEVDPEAEWLLLEELGDAASAGTQDAGAHQGVTLLGAAVVRLLRQPDQPCDGTPAVQDLHLVPTADVAEEARQVRLELRDGCGPHMTRVVMNP
jgi:hypothetical protein